MQLQYHFTKLPHQLITVTQHRLSSSNAQSPKPKMRLPINPVPGGGSLHRTSHVDPTPESSPLQTSKGILDIARRLEEIQAARRFESLGMANLLRLQVKIRHLEKQLWDWDYALDEAESREGVDPFEEPMKTLQHYSKSHISYHFHLWGPTWS